MSMINLEGQEFENFKVLYRDVEKDKVKTDKYVYWVCECKCPNHTIFTAKGVDIKNKKVISCGCKRKTRSNMENLISEILVKNQYDFKTEYSMPNCKYNDKGHLFFDFAIFKEGKLHCLIEYNGKQHYDSIPYWGGDEGLKIRQERDLIKYEYCKNNNIPLIIYSYLDKIEENKIVKDIESQKSSNYTLDKIKIEKEIELSKLQKVGIKCALVNEKNEILQTFNSYHDAARKILNSDEASGVRQVCDGLRYSYNNFIFRRVKEDGTLEIPELQTRKRRQQVCGISVFDKNDIVYYDSITQAAEQEKISRSSIQKCIAGNERYTQVNFRVWRKNEDNIIIDNGIKIDEVIKNYNNKYIFYNNKWQTVNDVARQRGLKPATVYARIRNGKTKYQALELEQEGFKENE